MSAGRMTGAGMIVTVGVTTCAVIAVLATAVRFVWHGDLDLQAVAWSTGLVGTAAALLARTFIAEPAGTPSDPVSTIPQLPAGGPQHAAWTAAPDEPASLSDSRPR